MRLNKHYLLTLIMTLGVQGVFGLNFANAVSECFDLKQKYCAENLETSKNLHESEILYKSWNCHIKDPQKYSDAEFEEHKEYLERAKNDGASLEQLISYANRDIDAFKEEITNAINERDNENHNLYKLKLCKEKGTLNWLQGSAKKSNSSSDQTSGSGSSSQSNKKTNQQSANNQSSSSLSEQRKKKLNEAVDQFNDAHNQKDYAKAFTALKTIVAITQDKQLKAKATNRLGEYYKFGDGVQKDEMKAQVLFEQASMDGDADADAHICQNHMNGKGGVTENHQTALRYCTTAANNGHVIAMAKLGWLYATGTGTQNTQLAKEWTCKAALKGHPGSIENAKILNFDCN